MLGEIDLAGLGELLHPLRQAHRRAEGRVVHVEVVADRADDDLAGVEAHADGEAESLGQAQLARVAPDLGAEMERRRAGAAGVILVRDRGAKERHDPVAGELVDGTLEAVHAVGEDREEAVEDPVPRLGVDPLGQLHRALDVSEEHGHLLALALEPAARRQHLLGEVDGRGQTTPGHRVRADGVTARVAEPCPGPQVVSAGRTVHGPSEAGAPTDGRGRQLVDGTEVRWYPPARARGSQP